MGIQSSLFAGVSGLNAAGNQISVIGDNIANVNTPGFKSARAEFQDVLSGSLGGTGGGSQIGAGTRLAGINLNFTQGSLESTGVTTDLALDGDGFFVLQDSTGTTYARSGMFRLNESQVLVNEDGQNVQGFTIDSSGVPTASLANVDLSQASSAPSATATVSPDLNLDSNSTILTSAFSHISPVSSFQTSARVFDSLGNPRNVTMHFRKTADNTWQWIAGAARADLDMAGYGGSFIQGGANFQTQFVPIQSGTLTFSATGALSAESTTAISLDYDQDGDGSLDGVSVATPQTWRWADGASSATIAFNFGTSTTEGGLGTDATTQYGGTGSSFVRTIAQDGFSQGSLQSVNIDNDGLVTGVFSNGRSSTLAQIAVARFASNNGLQRIGRNQFSPTSASGDAVVGAPNQGGYGSVRSGFLEQSNTDLADQFVKLIISQRAFQANTRTISTTNELLAQLVQLGN